MVHDAKNNKQIVCTITITEHKNGTQEHLHVATLRVLKKEKKNEVIKCACALCSSIPHCKRLFTDIIIEERSPRFLTPETVEKTAKKLGRTYQVVSPKSEFVYVFFVAL